MHIKALLQRWIDVLAASYFAWHDAWRARRSLVITGENDRIVIRQISADNGGIIRPEQPDKQKQHSVLAVLATGERASVEVSHAARSSIVILEIPGDDVVVRRVSVPVQAREFVAGIVKNQIDRLSPWHSNQAVYGFEADVDVQDAAALDVRVLIASRAVVDAALERTAATGLSVDRVVASLRNAAGSKGVTLWSRLADVSSEHQTRIRRHIGIGIAAAVVASFGLSLWATISAQLVGAASDDLGARTDALRRELQAPLTPQSAASLPPTEREWYEKETSPSSVMVIEALSRVLPDTAYVTELSLQNTTLRILGLTGDAPSLIAPLEHSGALTDVHFFAPTTREPDGRHFRFHIEARVEPYVELAESRQ